jgi:BirA family biotin operon repressor/biotin-[acetyl-CoA-carboxylase] ligase
MMTSSKNQLLKYLRERNGEWVSGESLSGQIGVSRSAVWKQISKLREEGYSIESSSKKGYLFQKASEMLLPNEIREGLETKLFGKGDIFYSREIDSTNRKARDLAEEGASEGTLVLSEAQLKGKGRKGRAWFSPPEGGIYISLILKPTISPVEAPKFTLLTAVAIAETLLSLTPLNIHIKWPNDILVQGKKIAGILTEMSTEMDAINYIVVGLGLNVNTLKFPDEIRGIATSILIETGKVFPRVKLIQEYLAQYEAYYDIYKKTGFDPIIDRWKDLSEIIGKKVEVEVIGNQFIGEALDIDSDGALILKDNQGGVHRIISGDITLS